MKRIFLKNLIGFFSTLIILSVILYPATHAHAETSKQRIYDHANILSDNEVKELEKIAEKHSVKRKIDFIIVTVENQDKDMQIYMDDFYDEEGLGFNKAHGDVAMIGLDMTERDVVLSAYDGMSKKLDPDRLTKIREKITPDLSDGNYFSAFELFITLSAKYMMYRPGVDPANPLFNTWVQFIIAVAVAAAIVWAMARNVETKMTTTPATYRDINRTKIIRERDQYVRTTVTKRRKPKSSGGGGGSGRSGGGFGRTGGGTMRSSSRGKF